MQTNATLLGYASMTAKQQKCWHLLALKFDQFQTSSNNFQQVATTRNNTQHGVQTLATCWAQQCCVLLANNVASVCTGLYNRVLRDIVIKQIASLWWYKFSMMACSCEKGRNNVSKGCMKKVRAWQNIDNDVAKCQAGTGGYSNEERH